MRYVTFVIVLLVWIVPGLGTLGPLWLSAALASGAGSVPPAAAADAAKGAFSIHADHPGQKPAQPAAPKTENPAAPKIENPAAPKIENPAAPKTENPAAPKTENPVASKTENPAGEKSPAEKPGAKSEDKPSAKPVPKSDRAPPAEAKPQGPAAPAQPAEPLTVKREPLRVELTIRGVFEARAAAEVAVRPQVWQTLEVQSAVEHGAAVKKGQVIVQFDCKKLDDEIADLKLKQALGELALKQAVENLKALEASTPLDLKQAERSLQIAKEDLEKFVRTDRALAERSAEFSLRQAEQMLEYEREELRQLEKMYKADDLTEETEEIVLKRQRNAVKAAEFRLEVAKANYHDTMKFDLPRRAEAVQQAAVRADISAAKARVLLPLALDQARRELERLKIERSREAERLKKLEADRQALTVKAPIDGVVYYGRFTRGRWSGAETLAESLRPGSTVTRNTVFMTVVQPRPLVLRGTVSEADLRKVRKGLAGMVEPAAFPFVKLPAVVEQVAAVPSAPDSFEVRVSVNFKGTSPPIMPGMNGTARFVVYRQDKALVVPARAVFSEPDEAQPYVFLVPKEGPPRKQPVRVGQTADDRVEILAGLRQGDRILPERPRPEESPALKAAKQKLGKKAKEPGEPKPRKPKATQRKPQDKKPGRQPSGQ